MDRNELIVGLYNIGVTADEIANVFGLSKKQVYNVLEKWAKRKPPAVQGGRLPEAI